MLFTPTLAGAVVWKGEAGGGLGPGGRRPWGWGRGSGPFLQPRAPHPSEGSSPAAGWKPASSFISFPETPSCRPPLDEVRVVGKQPFVSQQPFFRLSEVVPEGAASGAQGRVCQGRPWRASGIAGRQEPGPYHCRPCTGTDEGQDAGDPG